MLATDLWTDVNLNFMILVRGTAKRQTIRIFDQFLNV